MSDKIPYLVSHDCFNSWVERKGEAGGTVCLDPRLRLGMDRAPPPLRDQPPVPKAPPPPRLTEGERWERVLGGVGKTVDAVHSLQAWLKSPDPVKAPMTERLPPAETDWLDDLYRFALQDIPKTLQRLGMPKAARMFTKWFEGELNYSPTSKSSKKDINQHGEPYPESMIDRTSISLKWVLELDKPITVYLDV